MKNHFWIGHASAIRISSAWWIRALDGRYVEYPNVFNRSHVLYTGLESSMEKSLISNLMGKLLIGNEMYIISVSPFLCIDPVEHLDASLSKWIILWVYAFGPLVDWINPTADLQGYVIYLCTMIEGIPWSAAHDFILQTPWFEVQIQIYVKNGLQIVGQLRYRKVSCWILELIGGLSDSHIQRDCHSMLRLLQLSRQVIC